MSKILLNANEFPENNLKKLTQETLRNIAEINRYPDKEYRQLREAISRKIVHKDIENIVCGNGSDELIQLIIMAFTNPYEEVLALEPTFSEYRKLSDGLDRKYIGLSPAKNLNLNYSELEKYFVREENKLLFLCSPNNPTGEVLSPAELESILKSFNGIVVLDCAYIEFASVEYSDLLKKYDNLIILRTLSKAYGMASLRIGYAVGAAEMIEKINQKRMPFNVSGFSNAVAIKMLEQIDVEENVTKILHEKKRVERELENLELKFYPSEANFILIKHTEAEQITDLLSKENIVCRKFNKQYLENTFRINIGLPSENDKLLAVLKKVI